MKKELINILEECLTAQNKLTEFWRNAETSNIEKLSILENLSFRETFINTNKI